MTITRWVAHEAETGKSRVHDEIPRPQKASARLEAHLSQIFGAESLLLAHKKSPGHLKREGFRVGSGRGNSSRWFHGSLSENRQMCKVGECAKIKHEP